MRIGSHKFILRLISFFVLMFGSSHSARCAPFASILFFSPLLSNEKLTFWRANVILQRSPHTSYNLQQNILLLNKKSQKTQPNKHHLIFKLSIKGNHSKHLKRMIKRAIDTDITNKMAKKSFFIPIYMSDSRV